MCSNILVATFSAEHCPAFMAEEWLQPGKNSKTIRTCGFSEIGMDLAYFKHLRYLGDSLDHPILKQLVDDH